MPRPLICRHSARSASAMRRKPPKCPRTSRERSIAEAPLVPSRSTIANNSGSLRLRGPSRRSFSRGRSPNGHSDIGLRLMFSRRGAQSFPPLADPGLDVLLAELRQFADVVSRILVPDALLINRIPLHAEIRGNLHNRKPSALNGGPRSSLSTEFILPVRTGFVSPDV